MKRILVVDESPAVRETLALILGREFAVLLRPVPGKDVLGYSEEKVDLLILGMSSSLGEVSNLSEIASQVPFPVLFLVDSKQTIELGPEKRAIDCLAKPFNPYELRSKVDRLLARSGTRADAASPPLRKEKNTEILQYPYLPPSTSLLAKRFAPTGLPILVIGELGSGQERIARAMYSLNDRAGPWISVFLPRFSREFLLEQIAQACRREGRYVQRFTLYLHGLDTLSSVAQASLLAFLQDEEERGTEFWIISSSRADLQEKMYRGEFLEGLYYRVATLTLRLTPLRERLQDVPALATRIAQECAQRLGLSKATLTQDALERLKNYLWFGNLSEMEAVISRTIAAHRREKIEGGDLWFGFAGDEEAVSSDPADLDAPSPESFSATRPSEENVHKPAAEARQPEEEVRPPASGGKRVERHTAWGNGDYPDLKILINELAHELKNPMVTIKTFAQLLSERFDDATFRIRFQETVGGDIERMDDLLEALLDFSRFSYPLMERVLLQDQIRQILEEIAPECIRREATIRWGRQADHGEVFADEVQFRYALKNVLRTVLVEIKPKGEIQIDVEEGGKLSLSYLREGARMSSFTQYLGLSSSGHEEETLPLRLLLARIVLIKLGGRIDVNNPFGDRVLIRIELPAA